MNIAEVKIAEDTIQGLPVIHIDETQGKDALKFASDNYQMINSKLNDYGAILLRGIKIQGSKKLEKILTSLFGEDLLEYVYRSTPRKQMRGKIYTSTEYPASESILLHNENAYSNRWPMRIAFYCVKASETGGATPIADSRKIMENIPQDIIDEFEQRKLVYVRNYSDIDLPWTEVFQTHDKNIVEQYCTENGVEFKWLDDKKLQTRQTNKAVAYHPITGEKVWFNQAHLFHISSQSEQVRNSLIDLVGMDGLPRNVYFADGGIIPDEYICEICRVYEENMIVSDWQNGDLLLLDNMLFAHGRQPYTGSRRILTAMAQSIVSSDSRLLKKHY